MDDVGKPSLHRIWNNGKGTIENQFSTITLVLNWLATQSAAWLADLLHKLIPKEVREISGLWCLQLYSKFVSKGEIPSFENHLGIRFKDYFFQLLSFSQKDSLSQSRTFSNVDRAAMKLSPTASCKVSWSILGNYPYSSNSFLCVHCSIAI